MDTDILPSVIAPQLLARNAGINAAAPMLPTNIGMPSSAPSFMAPTMPNVTSSGPPTISLIAAGMRAQPFAVSPLLPTNIATPGASSSPTPPAPRLTPTPTQTQLDTQRLNDLKNSGPGYNQLTNPWERNLAHAGDIALQIAGTVFSPARALEVALPGTAGNHSFHVGQLERRVQNDQANDQAQAQTAQTQASTAHENETTSLLPEQQDIRQQAQDVRQQAENLKEQTAAQQLDQAYAKLGYAKVPGTNGAADSYQPDPNSPVYRSHALKDELVQSQIGNTGAQEELRNAQAALANAKNDPTSPAFKQAQQRENVASMNAGTAQQRLSLSTKQYMMHAFGTDGQGHELPGVLHDDNGNPVGSVQAQNVRPTGTQRDAAGRADTMEVSAIVSAASSPIRKFSPIWGPCVATSHSFRAMRACCLRK